MAIDQSSKKRALSDAIVDFLSKVPVTHEASMLGLDPAARGGTIARDAALRAAAVSGALALPPGPAGLVTILPDLVGIWQIQAQMVADIAGAHGQSAVLTREQMAYCLFRHAAAHAVRDLIVRVGERYVVRRATLRMMQTIAQKIGIKISQRIVAKSVARWLPAVGALGVAAYAYYDTGQVAETAIELFSNELSFDEKPNTDVEH